MFGIFSKPPSPKHGDRPNVARVSADQRIVAKRGELRIVVFGLVSLAILVSWLLSGGRSGEPREVLTVPPVQQLAAMMAPELDESLALPTADNVAEIRPEVEAGLTKGERPSLLTGLSANVLAWAEILAERDRERPGLPQRVSGDDLARRTVEAGQSVVVHGRLDAMADAPIVGGDATGQERLAQWLHRIATPSPPNNPIDAAPPLR